MSRPINLLNEIRIRGTFESGSRSFFHTQPLLPWFLPVQCTLTKEISLRATTNQSNTIEDII